MGLASRAWSYFALQPAAKLQVAEGTSSLKRTSRPVASTLPTARPSEPCEAGDVLLDVWRV